MSILKRERPWPVCGDGCRRGAVYYVSVTKAGIAQAWSCCPNHLVDTVETAVRHSNDGSVLVGRGR